MVDEIKAFIVGPSKENGQLMLICPKPLNRFWERIFKDSEGKSGRVTDQLIDFLSNPL